MPVVPIPGPAHVQALCWLCRLHLLLHLLGPDICDEGVSTSRSVLEACPAGLHLRAPLFSLQSRDVGGLIWRPGLRSAADPGHMFLRPLTGQQGSSIGFIQL